MFRPTSPEKSGKSGPTRSQGKSGPFREVTNPARREFFRGAGLGVGTLVAGFSGLGDVQAGGAAREDFSNHSADESTSHRLEYYRKARF